MPYPVSHKFSAITAPSDSLYANSCFGFSRRCSRRRSIDAATSSEVNMQDIACPFVDVFAFKSRWKPVDRAHQQAERNATRYSQRDFQVPSPYSPYNGIESEHVSEQVTDRQMSHQVDALTETNGGVVSQAPFTSKFERKVQDHRQECESGEYGDRPAPIEIKLVVGKHCVKESGRSARGLAVERSRQRLKH